MPSSAKFISSAINRNGDVSDGHHHSAEAETFRKLFELWISEQNQQLQNLISASEDPPSEADLQALISRVVHRYEVYYRAKSRSADRDVLAMLTPSWLSSFEEAFLWVGGWRPSMAFHLLLSKSGIQFESKLPDLLRGLHIGSDGDGDLADLSPCQITRIDDLQRKTIAEERSVTEALAMLQETVADASMVQLSHAVAEMARGRGEMVGIGEDEVEERVGLTMEQKEEGLKGILKRADDLRLRTLRGVVDLLNPIQAVHFLIAAAELHIWVHEWGKKRDAMGPHSGGNQAQQEPCRNGNSHVSNGWHAQ